MTALLTELASPPLPSPDAHWQEWVDYSLRWASVDERHSMMESAAVITRGPVAGLASETSRNLTLHAYRETRPGARWQALYAATWPAYRRWYAREGLAARPSLDECRSALAQHLPELLPTWERLCHLTGDDPVAARMLSMWGLPAFSVGCSQVVIPGEQPTLIRNYDYDQALFEGVIALRTSGRCSRTAKRSSRSSTSGVTKPEAVKARTGVVHYFCRQMPSSSSAVPWPTPTHMVARPSLRPCAARVKAPSRVMTRREPEEPSGWPRAIAPPSC